MGRAENKKTRKVSVWNWMGTLILSAIPGVNIIAMILFIIFVNDKELMHFSYVRYIENKIREAFDFRGTSIKIIIRERNDGDDAR